MECNPAVNETLDLSKLQIIKFPGKNRSHLLTSTFCRRKISANNSSHHSSTSQVSLVFGQEVIGSGPGKLENKPWGVARNPGVGD